MDYNNLFFNIKLIGLNILLNMFIEKKVIKMFYYVCFFYVYCIYISYVYMYIGISRKKENILWILIYFFMIFFII